MHRYGSRSRASSVSRKPGLRFVGLSLGFALLFSIGATQGLTPSESLVNSTDQSCKPSPAYGVELIAAGDDQWTLVLSNAAQSRELVVWMWSEVDAAGGTVERQKVWSGSLDAVSLQRISVRYAAPAQAVRIWACLESPEQSADLQAASMRGFAVVAGPAASTARHKTHVLTEDPESGRPVEQYVGQGGVQ